MFARNLLQAGDYVTCVPVGVPLIIQYAESGNIEKVFEFHEESEKIDISDILLQVLMKNHIVPVHIPVKGGTTFIYGALHTNKLYSNRGALPECVVDDMIADCIADPFHFKFYAGYVRSLATTFRGSVAIRQWLAVSGFACLPGYLVPMGIDEIKFEGMVANKFPFRYPLISSYILYQKTGEVTFPKTRLSQFVVKRVDRTTDQNGYIFGQLRDKETSNIVQVPYSTVVTLDINPNSLVIVDSDGDMLAALPTDNVIRERRSKKIQCSTCGKYIQVPSEGQVRCSDSHCNSVLFPRVNYMLSKLNLPTMSYERYLEVTKQVGSVFSLVDVFDLPEYNENQIPCTLGDVIRAVVPRSIIINDNSISAICNACNDSTDVFCYYISHVDRMMSDLSLDITIWGKFFQWLEDPENVEDLKAVLGSNCIRVSSSDKKFEGAPIFRGKTIMITGSFAHGSLAEITSILASYSAAVTQTFSTAVNCVLVGDLNENTNAFAVKSARKSAIPVMQESEFFKQYDIDSDLAENL